uniref:Uncharacterized protein n=1 Tax=Cacopsylla melanoneura TaxID=428564 RepID=A0A8D8TL18_9HEMI
MFPYKNTYFFYHIRVPTQSAMLLWYVKKKKLLFLYRNIVLLLILIPNQIKDPKKNPFLRRILIDLVENVANSYVTFCACMFKSWLHTKYLTLSHLLLAPWKIW